MDVLDLGLLHCPKIEGIDGKDYFSNMTIELFDEFPGYFIESWYISTFCAFCSITNKLLAHLTFHRGVPGGEGNCNGVEGPIGDLPFCQRNNRCLTYKWS